VTNSRPWQTYIKERGLERQARLSQQLLRYSSWVTVKVTGTGTCATMFIGPTAGTPGCCISVRLGPVRVLDGCVAAPSLHLAQHASLMLAREARSLPVIHDAVHPSVGLGTFLGFSYPPRGVHVCVCVCVCVCLGCRTGRRGVHEVPKKHSRDSQTPLWLCQDVLAAGAELRCSGASHG